ncbi:MAG: DNA adenine methylase [Desulfarculus sp.]|nr:DNA adenine methylase [Desulfarculus sp.]
MAKSPVAWLGGKARLVSKLLMLFPPHHVYVEAFGGGAWVLLAKEPSPVEVYNDLDSRLVNFFRVLRDPEQAPRLFWLCAHTPYSREEWRSCRDTWAECDDLVERAWRWFVMARQGFGGATHSWGSVVSASNAGQAETTSSWLSAIGRLHAAHERLLAVQVEHQDARALIPRYDTPETLFYLDPPYAPATRQGGGYRHELGMDDHRDLVEMLLGLAGMVILSGYDHAVYRPLERAGWDKRQFLVTCSAAGRTRATGLQGQGHVREQQQRVECVWISPAATARRRAARIELGAGPGPLFGGET